MLKRDDDELPYWEAFAGDDLAIPIQLMGPGDPPLPMKIGAGDGMTDIVAEFTTANDTAYQSKYSADPSLVTLVDSTTGRAMVIVPAAQSILLQTSKTQKQVFTVYTVINDLQTTWEFRLKLKPRPVPAS